MGIVPPVSAFERHIISGLFSNSNEANKEPVLPKPVITSSAIVKTFCWLQIAINSSSIVASYITIPAAPNTKGSK